MIAPTPFFADRGCHVRIYEEARALQGLGNEVTICTYHNGRDIEGIHTERIPNMPWYSKLEAGPSYHKFYLDFLLLLKVLKVASRVKPDVIHAHLHEGAFIGKFAALVWKLPLIFDHQGSLSEELVQHKFLADGSWRYRVARYVEGKIDRAADAVLSSCSRSTESLLGNFGLDADRVMTLTDGVDVDRFRPVGEGAGLEATLKLPSGKTVVAFLGLLNDYQGVDLLLEAAKTAVSENGDLHFLIMGYPNVDRYERASRRLGVSDFVTFTGRVDYRDAPTYLSLADLAVAPKIAKTEANAKLLNYMACGLPTIAFDTGVNREILGDLGIYAKFGDSGSLAQKILDIAGDRRRLAVLKRKVREKVVAEFSWNRVAERTVECYGSVSKRKAGVARKA